MLFNTFFEDNGGSTRRWAPAMDLADAGDHLVLKADLPGLSEDDVRIEVHEQVVLTERHHTRGGQAAPLC